MKLKFSIIIPVYNVGTFLRECLDSVLNQSYKDWEAICVDDGSTDESGRILDEYTPRDLRIKVVHQENGGLSIARNTGLRNATGEYVLFLDSDDVLTQNALTVLNQQIETYHSDVITFNAELWYAQEGRRAKHGFSRQSDASYTTGKEYLINFIKEHHCQPAAACFYCVKNSIIRDHKLQFEPKIVHEDELWVPLMLLHTAGLVTEVAQTLYLYRMRSGSIVHSENEKSYRDLLYIGAVLEKKLKQFQLPKEIEQFMVLNNIRHGLFGLKKLGKKLPKDDICRALRNADWRKKCRLIYHLLTS